MCVSFDIWASEFLNHTYIFISMETKPDSNQLTMTTTGWILNQCFLFFLVWIVAIFSWQNSNMLKYSNMLKFSNKLKYSNRLKLSKKSNIQICSNFQICSNIQICLPSFFSSELWPCDTKPCPPDLWVVFLLWYLNICFECVHQTCELYCCCCDVCF